MEDEGQMKRILQYTLPTRQVVWPSLMGDGRLALADGTEVELNDGESLMIEVRPQLRDNTKMTYWICVPL